MNMKDIRKTAREKLKGWCRVCPVCDGRACAGEVPGMGGAGTGASFMENVRALAAWKLNLRTLHTAATPDPAADFFGQALSMPVMGAPLAGAAINFGGAMSEQELADALHDGCAGAGTLCWCGDSANPAILDIGLAAISRHGGRGVPTIKPRGAQAVIERVHRAEDAGAVAVAVDVDTASFVNMTAQGQPVGPTTPEDIRAIVEGTSLPVILKGIMTPDEARLAASLGVAGVVVSNHGGRVLDSCPGTADVLPLIAAEVRGSIKVLVDGGIRSGTDVLKALALGADAVLIGRPLIQAAAGGGAKGVTLALEAVKNNLTAAMILTGLADLHCVEGRILTRPAR